MTTLPNRVSLNAAFLHQLEIMQAVADGKQVQSRMKNSTTTWHDYFPSSIYQAMNFKSFDFRIKPPEPRVFYIIFRANGEIVSNLTEEKKAQSKVKAYNEDPYLSGHKPYTYAKVVEEIK